jgi:uncharacterized membrane-anchored protein YhcB (DUF1043 family)
VLGIDQMAVEIVIGIVLVSLLAGVGIGYYLLGAGRTNKAKAAVAELEGALGTAQAELADYKRDVFGEFAQTAEKFRALDKSYNDLHRQLAESSVALCGDDGTLLLESPLAPSLDIVDEQVADEEIVVAEASDSEALESEALEPEKRATSEASAQDTVDVEADANPENAAAGNSVQTDSDSELLLEKEVEKEAHIEAETETEPRAEAHESQDLPDDMVAQDPDSVPTLTEVDSTHGGYQRKA